MIAVSCKNCSYQETHELELSTEHEYSDWEVVMDKTTIEREFITHKCSICGKEETSYREHKFGDWEVISQPTATKPGLMSQECEHCGIKNEEEITE